jgi:hypothetical protein
MANTEFIRNPSNSAFLLVDRLNSQPIAGKILVASARSPQHEMVLSQLQSAFQTQVELLYLDEIFCTTQLAGFIEKQIRYLDAAVAEVKQALSKPQRENLT